MLCSGRKNCSFAVSPLSHIRSDGQPTSSYKIASGLPVMALTRFRHSALQYKDVAMLVPRSAVVPLLLSICAKLSHRSEFANRPAVAEVVDNCNIPPSFHQQNDGMRADVAHTASY